MKAMTRSCNESEWTTIIQPRTGWFDINLSDLWRYRDLILLFVRRDFVANYKQTILGPLWFLLHPLLTTLVFTLIFGMVAKISTDGTPRMLFYLSGLVMWNYFANCLIKTSDTFVSHAAIFGKVYFPRLTVPVSTVLTNMLTFCIQFGFFLVLTVVFYMRGAPVRPNLWVLVTPLLLVQMAALGLGVGILVSSMTTRYRDLSFLVSFSVQLWMYATPVVYPMSLVPARWQWLYTLNPMVSIVEAFRHAFLGTGSLNPRVVITSLGITGLLLILGVIFFNRVEKTFMDTV